MVTSLKLLGVVRATLFSGAFDVATAAAAGGMSWSVLEDAGPLAGAVVAGGAAEGPAKTGLYPYNSDRSLKVPLTEAM